MLEHESMRVREYVHGVLYSLLKLRDYMALAQGMALEDILQALQDVYKSQNLSNLARQVVISRDFVALESTRCLSATCLVPSLTWPILPALGLSSLPSVACTPHASSRCCTNGACT